MSIIVFPGYEGASIHYRPDLLNDDEKSRGIEVESLPSPERQVGKYAVLMGDLKTGKVWYEYKDIPPNPESEEIKQLKNLVADLAEIVLMGGM